VSELAGTEAQLAQEPLDDVDAAERLPAEIEPTILRMSTIPVRNDTRNDRHPSHGVCPVCTDTFPRDGRGM
jgi:hypothetical protein